MSQMSGFAFFCSCTLFPPICTRLSLFRSFIFHGCRWHQWLQTHRESVLIVLLGLFVWNSSSWCQRKHTCIYRHTSSVRFFFFAPIIKLAVEYPMLALTLKIDLKLNDVISASILFTPTIQTNWQIEKCRLIYWVRKIRKFTQPVSKKLCFFCCLRLRKGEIKMSVLICKKWIMWSLNIPNIHLAKIVCN